MQIVWTLQSRLFCSSHIINLTFIISSRPSLLIKTDECCSQFVIVSHHELVIKYTSPPWNMYVYLQRFVLIAWKVFCLQNCCLALLNFRHYRCRLKPLSLRYWTSTINPTHISEYFPFIYQYIIYMLQSKKEFLFYFRSFVKYFDTFQNSSLDLMGMMLLHVTHFTAVSLAKKSFRTSFFRLFVTVVIFCCHDLRFLRNMTSHKIFFPCTCLANIWWQVLLYSFLCYDWH